MYIMYIHVYIGYTCISWVVYQLRQLKKGCKLTGMKVMLTTLKATRRSCCCPSTSTCPDSDAASFAALSRVCTRTSGASASKSAFKVSTTPSIAITGFSPAVWMRTSSKKLTVLQEKCISLLCCIYSAKSSVKFQHII